MPLVEFRQVSKRFAAGPHQAVDAVSFAIEPGEFFSLLGPSGCGKTTTLRLLAGLERPDSGEILIGGEPAAGLAPYERRLGMVFQSYALFPHLSVARNVGYGLERRRVPKPELADRVARALELVQLAPAEFAGRRPDQLSGGQRQRVALARALVLEPELLLLDEPLGAIDLKLRQAMQLELRQLNRRLGITFVYVTHDQDEALSMSDRIAVMHRGRLEQLGTPAEIYERPRSRFVAQFIGESNFFSGTDGSVLAVRPERVELLAADPVEPGTRSGVVEELIYQGDRQRVVVRLGDGSTAIAVLAPDELRRRELAPGTPVQLRWRAEDAHPVDPR